MLPEIPAEGGDGVVDDDVMILTTALGIRLHLDRVVKEETLRQKRQVMQRVFRGDGQKLLVGDQQLFLVPDQRPEREREVEQIMAS